MTLGCFNKINIDSLHTFFCEHFSLVPGRDMHNIMKETHPLPLALDQSTGTIQVVNKVGLT